ncbi:zinc finger protein 112-like [Calliphora vicina]|uniref:zinc finger protein 112-like n=1 Tax=Calliphora vicina TaxID=7373 RepID=UPI00325C0840
MEINITWNICRVCLVEEQKKPQASGGDESMRHLFNEDKQLAKHIYECSGISMKPNDNLPEKICKKCLTLVKYAINFRKTCRSSDTYLQTILQRTKSASILFKPERPPSVDFEEDNIANDAIIEEIKEGGLASEEEAEKSHILKRPGTPLDKSPKKLCNDTNFPEINSNTDHLIAHDDEEELADNDLNNMVEMEEILEHSEPAENHDSSLDKNIDEQEDEENEESHSPDEKLKSAKIQDFQMNEATAEEDDYLDENTQETAIHDIKQNSGEYYYLKDIKNENITHEQNLEDDDDEHHIETDDQDENIQFIPIEEGEDEGEEDEVEDQQLMLDCESDMEDNQALVSSTVVTKEEAEGFIELQEQDSNLSNATNDLQTEYIVDEYLIDDSSSNISSRNSSVVVVNSKMTKTAKRSVVTKNVEHNKASASSSSSSQQQVWVCDLCGNNFGSRQLINAHMKVHRQEKNHECELCFKRFITACNLQAHMRMHTGEKPFECQYCGRRFSDRSSNLRHERIHTNEKPFQCNLCGKAFSLATTLKKHMKVHTGERSYRCEPCAKSFKLPHQLKAHKNTTLHKAVEQLDVLAN